MISAGMRMITEYLLRKIHHNAKDSNDEYFHEAGDRTRYLRRNTKFTGSSAQHQLTYFLQNALTMNAKREEMAKKFGSRSNFLTFPLSEKSFQVYQVNGKDEERKTMKNNSLTEEKQNCTIPNDEPIAAN